MQLASAISSPKRKALALFGPAFMVSVGYMDPGNWGTDLKGGSAYGFKLLWVILLSNIIAQFLQIMCVKLGIGSGLDLAQGCRKHFSKPVSIFLWLLAEVAIIACDLAEVIGSAVAIKILFGIPLIWGVLITGLDVLLLMGLQRYGVRKLEALVIVLVATIFVCFGYQMVLANPPTGAVLQGMVTPTIPDSEALLIAVGILGATVMPHNLYLHSSIVKRGAEQGDLETKRFAIKAGSWDTVIALSLAFLVNASILILASTLFFSSGTVVEELEQGHKLIQGLLGSAAGGAFALALLCSGQSSTITGTMAGQIVMEGFLDIKVKPWLRRLITRGIALIPAVIVVQATGGQHTVQLLVISQVILSIQLPFAVFPLMLLVRSKKWMGEIAIPNWQFAIGMVCGVIISGLNIYLLTTAF